MIENLKYSLRNTFHKTGFLGMFPASILGFLFYTYPKGLGFALAELKGPLIYSIAGVVIWLFCTFLWYLSQSSFAIKNSKLLKNRNITNNIDDSDLQKLLHGFILGNAFFYKSEITCCNPFEFKGKKEIEKLKEDWIKVYVPAPKYSLANIKFHLSNGHPSGKVDFYILDKNGKSVFIDIYLDSIIPLDQDSCFSFKIVCSDDYEINEHASLQIFVESWEVTLNNLK